MTAYDANGHAWTMAALSFLLQDMPDAADQQIAHLNQTQTDAAWHAVNALQSKLSQRTAELMLAAADDRELLALIAAQVPAGVEGYGIGGRT